MSNLLKHTLIFCISLFSISIIAQDTIPPPRVSIQGTLKDANGAAAEDNTYLVRFDLYGQITGGVSKWHEIAEVEVSGGIYSHYLGSVNELEATVFDSTLFLGLTVGNFELTPRTELTYAPYTFAANTALRAQEVICSGALGDVKYSILAPDDFASVNGDCWVPMDGRVVVNTRYSDMFNQFQIPDASGLFLRGHEFAGGADNDPDRTPTSDIGQVQSDMNKSHNHVLGAVGNHSHGYTDFFDKDSDESYSFSHSTRGNEDDEGEGGDGEPRSQRTPSTSGAGGHTHSIDPSGGGEARPKNINLYVYIRVN